MPPFNASSWKNLVTKLTDEAEFRDPVDEGRLAAAGQNIGVLLPLALSDFLKESDGLTADYGSGMIWPAEEIGRRNREFRSNPEFQSRRRSRGWRMRANRRFALS